jgi:hypothetical protein
MDAYSIKIRRLRSHNEIATHTHVIDVFNDVININ